MSILFGSARFGMAALLLAAGFINTGVSPLASATVTSKTYNLNTPDTALQPYASPFGKVKVTRLTSTTATVDFLSNTASGYYFLGSGSVAANVNGAFNLQSIGGTYANQTVNGKKTTPVYSDGGPGQEDSFGNLDLAINSFDGFTYKSSEISLNLSATKGNSWNSATDVLTANHPTTDLWRVATHVGVCDNPSNCSKFLATGYVADGTSTSVVGVPEPSSLAILGTSLLGLAWLSGGLRRRHRSHT